MIRNKVTGEWELDERDLRQLEYIYLQVWHEMGSIGGPATWFVTFMRFFEQEKCDVKERDSRETK